MSQKATIIRKGSNNIEYYNDGKLVKEIDTKGTKDTSDDVQVIRVNFKKNSKTGKTSSSSPSTSREQAEFIQAEKIEKVKKINNKIEQDNKAKSQEYINKYGVAGSIKQANYINSVQPVTNIKTESQNKAFSSNYFTSSYLLKEGSKGNLKTKEKEEKKEKVFKNKFFSLAGQKERIKNIPKVFVASAKSTAQTFTLGLYKSDTRVKANIKEGKIKTSTETLGNQPLQTALLGTSGVKLGYQGLKTAVKGIIGYKVVGFGSEEIAKSKSKEFVKVQGYKDILGKGLYEEAGNINKFNIAYQLSPNFASKETKKIFKEAVYDELKKKGYDTETAIDLTEEAYKYRQIRGTGEGFQQLIAGATSERIGRGLLNKGSTSAGAVFTKVGVAGMFEGTSNEYINQNARNQKFNSDNLVNYGSVGFATAGGFSLALKQTKGITNRALEGGGNLADPFELPSDKLAGGIKQEVSKVNVVTPTFTQTNNKPLTTTEVKESIGKNTVNFDDIAFKSKNLIPSFTQTSKVITPTFGVSSTVTNTKNNPFVQPKPNVKNNTSVFVKSETKPFVNSKAFINTNTKTNAQTNTKTNAQTNTRTYVNIMTPNNFIVPLLPNFPKGGGFNYKRNNKKISNQPKKYTPSSFAIFTGIKGKQTNLKTGFDIRPIISNKKRKKRKLF